MKTYYYCWASSKPASFSIVPLWFTKTYPTQEKAMDTKWEETLPLLRMCNRTVREFVWLSCWVIPLELIRRSNHVFDQDGKWKWITLVLDGKQKQIMIHGLDQERKWKWIWTTAVTHCDRVEISVSVGLRSLQWESREIYENFGWKRTEKSLEDLYMDDLQLPAEAWRQLARRDNYTMKIKPIVKTPLKNGGLD